MLQSVIVFFFQPIYALNVVKSMVAILLHIFLIAWAIILVNIDEAFTN